MRKQILCLQMVLFSATAFAQSTGSLAGKVTGRQTSEPLSGATVAVRGIAAAITNSRGEFVITGLKEDKIVLVVSYVGYEDAELPVSIFPNQTTNVNVSLVLDERKGSEVVVTASKRPEKFIHAPASIQVLGVKDFERFAGSNVNEMVSKVQGVEFTRTGVDGITFNARGLNSAFNNKVMLLVDGRNSMSALSAGLPLISINGGGYIKDDIERMEIVLGPQSALYGPNAQNIVFNFITRDPRKHGGTTVSMSAGSRYQFSGRFRQAAKINDKWAYKLTGEYAAGKEFEFYDSVYAGGGEFGTPVAIPERNVDFNFRHIRGGADLYYSLSSQTDLIVSGGGSNNNFVQVTTAARNQMRGVTYGFLQARLVHPRFYATVYNTWGNLGSSYNIASYTRDFWNRTHSISDTGHNRRLPPDSAEIYALRNRFKEANQRLNAETQYNYTFQKAGLFLIAGLNYQRERPNGFGINLVDSSQRITITQYGALLQLEKTVLPKLRFVAAMRYDNHGNFGNFFAPKFALVKNTANGSVRISWAKAYAMPSIQNQYAGIGRSLFGNGGEGIKYIPNNTKFSDPASVKTTTPLQSEEVSTWETGYKGTIAKKLFIDINYYHGRSKNFISPSRTVAGRVLTVNGFAVTHSPVAAGLVTTGDTLKNASFSTFFNYGVVRNYGIDAGLSYQFTQYINLAVKYSWTGSDITRNNMKNDGNKDGIVSSEEKSLNAPKNRAVAILGFQNLCKKKLFMNIAARYVQQYDFYSGFQVGAESGKGQRGFVEGPGGVKYLKNFNWGPLGGFTTIDVNAGYQFNKALSVNIGVSNLFNTTQIEFVGSPSIGRLIMAEVKVSIPDEKK